MRRDNFGNKDMKGSVLVEFVIALPIFLLLFGISHFFVSVFKEKAVLREAARLGVAATQYVTDVDDPNCPVHNDAAYLNELRNLAILVAYNNIVGQGLDANNYQYRVNYFWDNGNNGIANANALHWSFNGYNTKNLGRLYIHLAITTNRNSLNGVAGIRNMILGSTEHATLPLQNSIAVDDTRLLAAIPLGGL